MEKRSDHDSERRRGRPRSARRHGWNSGEFFGIDMDSLSPRSQAATGLAVGGAILAGTALLLILRPEFFWLIFVFGWVVFPAFGLFARGVAGLAESRSEPLPKNSKERELLGALREHGELTPTRAAMETSLSVAEADRMLKELAEGGYLEVRVRGGGLFYALWESEGAARELEDQG